MGLSLPRDRDSKGHLRPSKVEARRDFDFFNQALSLKGKSAALRAAQLLPLFEEANGEPMGSS